MRYDKTVCAPEEELVYARLGLADLKERGTLSHMRPAEEGIVCGEGYAEAYPLSAGASALYVLDEGVFVYYPDQSALFDARARRTVAGIATRPKALLALTDGEGKKGLYSVEEDATRYISAYSVTGASSVGGECAAMHHGRLFVGNGTRLRFSAPFSDSGLVQTDRDPDKAGYIDFETGKGRIVGLLSHRERLYLFFERGAMRMRASGEAVDFMAEEIALRGGSVLSGSVAAVGDRICYMTQDGLYSLDGGFCERPRGVDLQGAVSAYDYQGKYAAVVKLKTGKNALYVYDLVQKSGRLLLKGGLLAGGREYFLSGNSVYRLSAEGGLPEGGDCALEVSLSAVPRTLAWVRIEGEGEFELSAAETVRACRGGERVRIGVGRPVSVTHIRILAKSPDFCIRAIDIAWRKENGDRYS